MLNVIHTMFLTWKLPFMSRDYRLYFPPDTQDELGGFLESVLYGAQRISQFSSATSVPSVFATVVELGAALCEAFHNLRKELSRFSTKFLQYVPTAVEVTDDRLALHFDMIRSLMITFDRKWVMFEQPFITSLVGTMEDPPKMIEVREDAVQMMERALKLSTTRSPSLSPR